MKTIQAISDKFAIGLSLLCTVHCLILPLALVLLPSLAAMQLEDERFHTWMLFAVIPTSLVALTLGCKQHQRYRLLVLGLIGLALITLAVVWGHSIGEFGEKVLTVIGAALVATGHLWNYHLCQHQTECPCPEHAD